jgi:hypothetical protein
LVFCTKTNLATLLLLLLVSIRVGLLVVVLGIAEI